MMINKYHRELMEHTLGGSSPSKWYRNHFVADEDHLDYQELKALERLGFMERIQGPSFMTMGTMVFRVTPEGKQAIEMTNKFATVEKLDKGFGRVKWRVVTPSGNLGDYNDREEAKTLAAQVNDAQVNDAQGRWTNTDRYRKD